MAEKLRKCRDFSELRAGMLTVCKGCLTCGAAECRGMLVSRGQDWDGPYWLTMPNCSPDPTEPSAIGHTCVAAGGVYVVETGNDDHAEQREGRYDHVGGKDAIPAKARP